MLFPTMFQALWNEVDLPPTIYSILNSYVNFDAEEKTKIKNLASAGRSIIFDFDYPLDNSITKESFETMILNHYMMRRIGYETVTAFKLALNVKLNEIMPLYNKLIKSVNGWEIFEDGEVTIRYLTDNRSSVGNVTTNTTTDGSTNSTSDQRYSDTPQTALEDVRAGKYVSEYNYNSDHTDVDNTTDTTSDSTTTDNTAVHESISRTPADKMKNYQEFLQAKQNIYTMIFKDLDNLFYQLI